MLLLHHRLAAAIVLTALALVAGAFLFARPKHRQSDGGIISGAAYPAATQASGLAGWTWRDGPPGFVPTTGVEEWNISLVVPHDLARTRADARAAGVHPNSLRLVGAQRLSPRDLQLLVSGADTSGATCIGAELPSARTQFFCPSSSGTRRLGRQVAFMVIAAKPSFLNRGTRGFPLFLEAATRGDVTRVVLTAPEPLRFVHRDGSQTAHWTSSRNTYHRSDGWWGTFGVTLTDSYAHRPPAQPWRARLDFYGTHGLIATRRIALGKPAERVAVVMP